MFWRSLFNARSAAGALGVVLLASLPLSVANAQTFPDRPVRIVVPYTPGGGTDVVARAIGERLSAMWKQPVVVDNRPGAGTAVGGEIVAHAAPDGYTLLFSDSSTYVVLSHVDAGLRFDPMKDIVPVALGVRLAPVLAISNSTPAKTLPEFIAYAKAHPGELSYASPGVGTYTHIAMEYFKKLAGIDMLHVPYKGSAPALTDLLEGRVSSYFVTYGVFQSYEKAGKLKVIATGNPKRVAALPDLPTMGESVPGFGINVWFGMGAPAGTPAAILDKISADVNTVLRDPKFVEGFVKPQAYTAGDLTRAQFADQVKSDYAKWGEIVKLTGIKIE
jgi:tripartite-type tricarboxylate transporter receptor subunit TctC